jgi:hypothetical protein
MVESSKNKLVSSPQGVKEADLYQIGSRDTSFSAEMVIFQAD